MRTLHNIAIHKYIAFIQSAQYITDWVQLPTKTEMDIYRKKAEEPSHKQLTFTSATWGSAPEFLQLEIKKKDGQKKQKEETNERNEKVSGGIA
jgi:hypothetical protein